jgi:hypothetical protein
MPSPTTRRLTRPWFDESGAYALEGALAPVTIDLDRQTGIYEEPNV